MPGDWGWDQVLDGFHFAVCGHDGEPAFWIEELGCCGEGAVHVVNGAEGDAVEALGQVFGTQGFGAGGVDLCGEAKGADGFAKEGRLFILGFGNNDRDLAANESDGETGEAGSGTKIQ